MKRIFIFPLIFVLTVGCQTTQPATPTVMPTTTPVPTLVPTPVPTSTVNPCSNKGWEDIATYLRQYDQAVKGVQAGTSVLAFLEQLENYKNKVDAVDIDACTEHARQLIVLGMGNENYGYKILMTGGDAKDYADVFTNGVIMIRDAKDELKGLGIQLNYP